MVCQCSNPSRCKESTGLRWDKWDDERTWQMDKCQEECSANPDCRYAEVIVGGGPSGDRVHCQGHRTCEPMSRGECGTERCGKVEITRKLTDCTDGYRHEEGWCEDSQGRYLDRYTCPRTSLETCALWCWGMSSCLALDQPPQRHLAAI